ncbi:MAG: hypothetical protein KAI20_00880 [Thermoplasmatales archaeon]|nr:hypothetical protein [Thermoplasmatales archaeon]
MFDDILFTVLKEEEANTLIAENESMIYIDTQESKIIKEIINILKNEFGRSNIFTKQLLVGDVLIISADGLQEFVLERKTPEDLVSSMKDGRADDQHPNLMNCENGFLVTVGEVYEKSVWSRTNFNYPDSVTRYLGSLIAKTNIDGNRAELFQLPTHRQLAVLIDYFAKLFEENKMIRKTETRIKKFGRKKLAFDDPKVLKSIRISQIAQIGKINIKTAKKLMDHFKDDYKKIQNASIKEIIQVDGIGKVLAKRIFDTYNL